MSIIEREIEKRENIIKDKEGKIEEISNLEIKITELKEEISKIDDVALVAEIEELKTYLPKPEQVVEEDCNCPESCVNA